MKQRFNTITKNETIYTGNGLEVAIRGGETVARYERYSYGSLSGEWTEWRTFEGALKGITRSRGQVNRRAIERAAKAGFEAGYELGKTHGEATMLLEVLKTLED